MTGYKIYITKSAEAAHLMRRGVMVDLGKEGIKAVESGCVCEDNRIPAIYHSENNFFCAVEYNDRTSYKILMVAIKKTKT